MEALFRRRFRNVNLTGSTAYLKNMADRKKRVARCGCLQYAVPVVNFGRNGGNALKKLLAMRATADGLTMPNRVAFRDGALCAAEVDRLLRYDALESRLGHGRDRMNSSNAMRRTHM